MKCVLVFGFFHPDNSVSAKHFTELAVGLKKRGFDVEVLTSGFKCRSNEKIKAGSDYCGVKVWRAWRPSFLRASSNVGRLLISFFLSVGHFFKILFDRKADVVLFGTNPEFEYFLIPFLKFFKPKTKYAIYGFDLYPEAMTANKIRLPKFIYKMLYFWAGVSYRKCDLLVDIGSCMRARFEKYRPKAQKQTIVPWAFHEPEDIERIDADVRKAHFGDAKLGILYSGTVGVVHRFDEVLELARELRRRNADVAFCFAGYGNKYGELKAKVLPEDTNISFAGFIDEKDLGKRLSCSDISVVTLGHGFEGVSVPSKFFGAIATGQPILYSGTRNSSLVKIIEDNSIGFCLFEDNIKEIADKIESLSRNPSEIWKMKERAIALYKAEYSREKGCDKFYEVLSRLKDSD